MLRKLICRLPKGIRRKASVGLRVEPLEPRYTPATVGVDVLANAHAIDPNIYGSAYATAAQIADLHLTVNRDGGNASDTYSYTQDATNHGSDWYFESIAQGTGNGQSMDSFITDSQSGGADPSITLNLFDWAAKLGVNGSILGSFPTSTYTNQQSIDPYNGLWGNGVNSNGSNITGNNPNLAYIANSPTIEQAWIQHLISTFGDSQHGGVKYYTLGNEPGLWDSTHRDIHPNGDTLTELYNRIVAYASMVKSLDPNAKILGPEEWGWTNYFIDGADAAAANWGATYNGMDAQAWLLNQLHQYDIANNQRLLDYFTLHFYPQGNEFSNDVSTNTELLRNQSTRSLWDPNYVDQSWIASTGIDGGKVDLIDRMKSWVNNYYPGTKIGITEYNWGAEGNMNGATTQADIWGIFGREGLDLANRWTTPATGSPTYLAMKMFRNYDGNGGAFGDTSVGASVANPDQVDAFASVRSSDGALTIMVINKNLYSSGNPSATTPITLNLSNFLTSGTAQAWQLAGINGNQNNAAITHLSDLHFSGNSLTVSVPMESVSMFVLMPATAPPAAPTGVTAQAVSSSEIDLAWNAVAGALSYQVQRSTDNINWASIATPSTNSYANTGLGAATTYYYQVLAVGSVGTSTPSVSVSATTLNVASNLPAGWNDADIGSPAPAGSAAVAGTTWTVNGSGAGIGNTADQLNFASEAVTGNYTAVAKVTSLTNTDSGAAAGVMFRDSSAAGSIFVGVFATEANGVTVQWRSSTDGASGSFSIGAVLAPTPTNPVWVRLVKSGAYFTSFYNTNGTTWTQVGATLRITLTNSTYRAGLAVTAHNNGLLNAATFTNVSLAKTVPPPAAPTGLLAASITASQINLSWTASTGATGYQVQRSTDNANWSIVAAPAAASYSDTGLASATRYYYRVLAAKLGSFSAPTTAVSAITRPPAPTGLSATVLSTSQIKLTWTATPGATSYRIQRSTNNTTWAQIATTTATTFTNTLLAAGTTYYYRIIAADAGGGSIPSAVVSAVTIPAAPTGLAVSVRTSTQINLTWTAVHGATGYQLQRSTDNVTWSPLATPTTPSYADASLPPGTTYYYRVIAVGVSGPSGASALIKTASRPSATFVPGTLPAIGSMDAYVFSVTYQSAAGINTATLGSGDIQVTGANGFLRTPVLLHFVTNADGSVTATYRFGAAPTGGWKPGLTYTVKLVASQVADRNGTAAAGGPLGTFTT